MDSETEFLGRGWGFPPEFDMRRSSSRMVAEEEDIKQSLFIILSTAPGERIMNPKFGCDLMITVFDSIDSLTINRIKDLVTYAVLNYEPRVTLHEVTVNVVNPLDGHVEVGLDYTIRKINVRTNIVFPFYLNEGTNVKGM
ncbi:MAG: GPW/gp25 family protein [Bacteroidota bacterium]